MCVAALHAIREQYPQHFCCMPTKAVQQAQNSDWCLLSNLTCNYNNCKANIDNMFELACSNRHLNPYLYINHPPETFPFWNNVLDSYEGSQDLSVAPACCFCTVCVCDLLDVYSRELSYRAWCQLCLDFIPPGWCLVPNHTWYFSADAVAWKANSWQRHQWHAEKWWESLLWANG